ncbi:DUF397 domain-containing protein [Streptomyces endophyticus]|uniref:DUF397 domain-containing protein n=1 Tax=Streptomyces endophyticus TaxID=714166 RepID=A0ABU6FJ99_9ACTN|nr:DUF397 domain-containing protein [Streptomyces endophyticus]MEB8344069.1 DUF397 domain-containing protein [Streptomyces endophyticus]
MNRKVSTGDGAELDWRKSSYSSNGSEGDCLEVAHAPDTGTVHLRDSKHRAAGPHLAVSGTAWAGFLGLRDLRPTQAG